MCFAFSFKHLQLSANHPRLCELLCAFQFLLKRLLQKQQTKGTSRPATRCACICHIHSQVWAEFDEWYCYKWGGNLTNEMRLAKVTQIINGFYRILFICIFLKAIRSRQQFMEVICILQSLVKLCSFLRAKDCTTHWKSQSSVIGSQTRLALCFSGIVTLLPFTSQQSVASSDTRAAQMHVLHSYLWLFCFPNSRSSKQNGEFFCFSKYHSLQMLIFGVFIDSY